MIEAHALRAFDLALDSLLQLELLQLEEGEYLLLFNMHHIISDGWSIDVLVREMTTLYEAIKQGVKEPLSALPALKIQYKDYAAWQNELLESESAEAMRAFWLNQLSKEDGMLPTLELPSDYARPAIKTYNGATLNTVIPAKALEGLNTFCQAQGATLFMGLTALVNSLLYRYTGQEDILIGTPVAGRIHPDLHDQIGFYVNTVVLRNRLRGEDSFEMLLNAVKTSTLAAFEHESYPFDRLVEDLDLPRDLSRSAVFDVLLVLQNNEQSELRFGDVALSVEEAETGISKFDLLFNFVETGEGLLMGLEYNTDLFKADRIARMADHLQTLIDSVLHDPRSAIGSLNLLPTAEKQLLLHDFNDTSAVYPDINTVAQLFEAQAELTPEQTALVFGETTLTYAALNEKANQLAHYLRNTHQIQANDVVALQIERSVSTIIGILGVLKSGAAYLPISTEFPPARVRYMLANSRAKTLLTDEISHVSALAFKTELPDLSIERLDEILAQNLPAHNPERINAGPDLAYVLYTSGSTGQPKGVSMPQRSLVNLIQWQNANCNLGFGDRTAQFVPYTFDVSFQEIFATLGSGGTLIVLPQDIQQQFTELPNFIAKYGINRLFLPFVGLQQLAELVKDAPTQLSDLKEIITAGEQLQSSAAIRHLLASLPNCVLKNQYGPTEAHVVSEYVLGSDPAAWPDLPPIGKPISNVELHILDAHFQPTPIGIPGELLIGGIALADGYLNNADLTAEKFIPHPFKAGERLYRTGDLSRWLPDGNIEYLGRIDQQLKIRGYRIETGEIEQVLLSHESVQTCAVVGSEFSGVKELAAYLVPKPETSLPDATILRSFLGNTLPDYMIPSYFVALESMPMTSSGKIDRKALPAPDHSAMQSGTVYVAPRNAVENQLVEIWQQVLGRDQIGVEDNFFNLGGHSLRAIRVVSLIRQALSVEIRLSEIFANPTIAALAHRIQTISVVNFKTLESIPTVMESADYALSNAQRRLWVIDQMSETAEAHAAYNMPAALRLRGDLDIAALERVFDLLFARHESLRTRFRDGRQVISPAAPYQLPQRDCRGMGAEAIKVLVEAHALRVFDLALDSLLQLELLQLEAGEYLFLFNMHHIISDGWSINVLVREMTTLYEAIKQGVEQPLSVLPALKIQYKDYAAWQNELLESESAEAMRAFWLNQLNKEDGMLPTLELPSDYARPANKTYNGATLKTVLPAEVLNGLNALCQAHGATLFMGLTALVKSLFYRYTGQEDILIGTPVAGRAHPDLHDQIGFYINTVVLRNRLRGEDSFETLLNAVKTNTLAAFEHEAYPFDRLVEDLDLPRDLSRSAVFDVMLALQNNEQSELRFGDVALSVEGATTGISKFDLTFDFVETAEGLLIALEYNTDLFKSDRIARMAEHLLTLLGSVLHDPKAAIGALNLLPAAEKQQLLHDFNDTAAEYPKDKTIVQLFEEQVAKTPDQTAVVFGTRTLSYRELNEQSNQLAHYLRDMYNILPDDIVALQLERSEWMIIAIMGVLKSGAAYLPIGPDLPKARTVYLLQDSQAKLLLTDAFTHESAQDLKTELPKLSIENISSDLIESSPKNNPDIIGGPEHLAYIIYTSGSTGQPKGVMIEHRSLVNFVTFAVQVCGFESSDRVLQAAAYTFDTSVDEIFTSLVCGAALYVINKETLLSTSEFLAYLDQNQISILDQTPAILATLNKADLKYVKTIITGGDAADKSDVVHYSRKHKYLNSYGPTECTIAVSTYLAEPDRLDEINSIPIGKPNANTEILILDENQQLVPVGIAGELCVSGVCLARGYLNNPELTAEKFRPHPFKTGELMYKTGDLARWMPDGNIEFLGRKDFQLKIRGNRVETGEIEQALLSHEAVQTCTVVGLEFNGVKELAAYLVPKPEATLPDATILRSFLGNTLPDYMIPSYFVAMESLPMTSSGKIDSKALPAPDHSAMHSGKVYVAPRNALENQLVEIWQQVLGRDQIGVEDNFFSLGGHSLRAIRLSTEISKLTGQNIPLRMIFQYPTIAELSAKISDFKAHFHTEGICFNPEAATTLFAFPPFGGLAVFYEKMAAMLPDYAWYCFDFLESDNRLELYYQQIKRQQPEGPYCMFGYSAGGPLAYEMARFMERKGETVRDIIFGDAGIRTVAVDFDMQAYMDDIAKETDNDLFMQQVTQLLEDATFYKALEINLTKYNEFLNNIQWNKPIRANIHQMEAQRSIENNVDAAKSNSDWSAQTTGSFFVYPAVGEHSAIFDAKHIEFNVLQLKFILTQIHQPQDELMNFPDADLLNREGHAAPEQLKYIGFTGDEFSEPIPEEMLSLEDLIEQHKALHTELLRLLQQKDLMTQAYDRSN
ncbi:MAG: amino acid adenylation domain-containing protein [Bacteroidota bacterium]